MASRSLALVAALSLTGCMRLHTLAPDGEGGAYMVAQKRFLGIGGKQTLLHCPVQGVITPQCGVVMDSSDVRDLGPVHYQPASEDDGPLSAIGDLLGAFGSDDYDYGDYGFDVPSDGPVPDCPEDALVDVTSIPEGTTVTLVALHPEDAYSGSEYERQLPITGTVSGDLHTNDACWMGGGFEASDGTSFYFYKAAFRLD